MEEELQDEYIGDLRVERTGTNVLPVGHTFVKGVDLLDGHLVSSSTDVSISGRGPAPPKSGARTQAPATTRPASWARAGR